MAEKRKKRKRKSKTSGGGGGSAPSSGGGVLQSIRTGVRRAAGAEEPASKESSRLGNIIWTILLIGAVALLLYRWYG